VPQSPRSKARITTIVEEGGELSNNKGINRKGGGLTAPALTEKDMEDIYTAAKLKADFLGVSFPRAGSDIEWARELLQKAGGKALMVAKIERAEAITALEDIVKASDVIMVARGDLAVEVGDAAVPALQKRMIRMSREHNKLVITATQMMESYDSVSESAREVSDVANVVLDGTDAHVVGETMSAYPQTIRAMAALWRLRRKTPLQNASGNPPPNVEEGSPADVYRGDPEHQGGGGDDAKRQNGSVHVAYLRQCTDLRAEFRG
jgi:pyruvate kinase